MALADEIRQVESNLKNSFKNRLQNYYQYEEESREALLGQLYSIPEEEEEEEED